MLLVDVLLVPVVLLELVVLDSDLLVRVLRSVSVAELIGVLLVAFVVSLPLPSGGAFSLPPLAVPGQALVGIHP